MGLSTLRRYHRVRGVVQESTAQPEPEFVAPAPQDEPEPEPELAEQQGVEPVKRRGRAKKSE